MRQSSCESCQREPLLLLSRGSQLVWWSLFLLMFSVVSLLTSSYLQKHHFSHLSPFLFSFCMLLCSLNYCLRALKSSLFWLRLWSSWSICSTSLSVWIFAFLEHCGRPCWQNLSSESLLSLSSVLLSHCSPIWSYLTSSGLPCQPFLAPLYFSIHGRVLLCLPLRCCSLIYFSPQPLPLFPFSSVSLIWALLLD